MRLLTNKQIILPINMFLARNLVSAAGTFSRMTRTYVNYPMNRASRAPLSSFLRRCSFSTTPDNISSGTSGSNSTTTNIKDATSKPIVGDNTINSSPDITGVNLPSSLSSDLGISAPAKTFLYKTMDRDERIAYLEETIKNKDAVLMRLAKEIASAAKRRNLLLEKEVLTTNEAKHLRVIEEEYLPDMIGRGKKFATENSELKAELKHPKEPAYAPLFAQSM